MMQTVLTSNIGNTFIINSKMTQENYLKLGNACGTIMFSDDEARSFICSNFGFDREKVLVLHKAGLQVYVTTVSTKDACAEIPRIPLYNATDWNYVRFRVCGILWEVIGGDLAMIAE